MAEVSRVGRGGDAFGCWPVAVERMRAAVGVVGRHASCERRDGDGVTGMWSGCGGSGALRWGRGRAGVGCGADVVASR
ncbi:hypothetical protein GCM10023334_009590 [Nonomuraea thailandensis]